MVRRALGKRTRSLVYFEVPDGAVIFRRRVVWNVVYEHCSYFTVPSLSRLFTESGFEVRSVAPCFRDEYLGIEASPSERPAAAPPESAEVEALARDVASFGELYGRRSPDGATGSRSSAAPDGPRFSGDRERAP